MYEHPLVVSNASLHAALNITKMHRSMKDVVLARSSEEMEVELGKVADAERVVFENLDVIRTNILGEEGLELENKTRQLFVDWRPIRKEVVRLLESGNRENAVLITKGIGATHVAKLEDKMLELTRYARDRATGFLEQAEDTYSRLQTIIRFSIFFVSMAVFIALLFTYRVLEAERLLQDEKNRLQESLEEIRTLRGIIPICSQCKQIRDDKGYWKRIEEYIHTHSEAKVSHGICPDCMKKLYPEEHAELYPDETETQ